MASHILSEPFIFVDDDSYVFFLLKNINLLIINKRTLNKNHFSVSSSVSLSYFNTGSGLRGNWLTYIDVICFAARCLFCAPSLNVDLTCFEADISISCRIFGNFLRSSSSCRSFSSLRTCFLEESMCCWSWLSWSCMRIWSSLLSWTSICFYCYSSRSSYSCSSTPRRCNSTRWPSSLASCSPYLSSSSFSAILSSIAFICRSAWLQFCSTMFIMWSILLALGWALESYYLDSCLIFFVAS